MNALKRGNRQRIAAPVRVWIAPCQESADLNRYTRNKERVAHPRARNPVSYGPRIRVISQDLFAREINDVRHRRMTHSVLALRCFPPKRVARMKSHEIIRRKKFTRNLQEFFEI